jgi:hypothetical protein
MKKEYLGPTIVLLMGMFFCLISAFIARGTDGVFFARSGAILCLLGTAAQFILSHTRRRNLETILTTSDLSKHQKLKMIHDKPKGYQVLFGLSSTAGVLGTLVWGYGDLLY